MPVRNAVIFWIHNMGNFPSYSDEHFLDTNLV